MLPFFKKFDRIVRVFPNKSGLIHTCGSQKLPPVFLFKRPAMCWTYQYRACAIAALRALLNKLKEGLVWFSRLKKGQTIQQET